MNEQQQQEALSRIRQLVDDWECTREGHPARDRYISEIKLLASILPSETTINAGFIGNIGDVHGSQQINFFE